MDLQTMILETLSSNVPLKASDIAKIIKQKYNQDVDKSEINSLLYSKLKGRVKQDNSYRWSILDISEKESIPSLDKANVFIDTPLSKLSSYYLECLSKDMDTGISEYASSKYGSPEYGQLFELPQLLENPSHLYESNDAVRVLNKVRRDKNRLTMQLGYPIYVRKISARTTFYVVEPIFLVSFDAESINYSNSPQLSDEMPRFNFEAISHLSGLDKNELFEEVMNLNDELGFNNDISSMPDLDDIVIRLQHIRPLWKWQENITPEKLTSTELPIIEREGIYNTAAVFYMERSKYTQGLEKELVDFKSMNPSDYMQSALGQWIIGNIKTQEIADIPIIEPIQMNEEQREAVKRSLQAPLTIITGPPGTGKSQVVTNIIINSVFRGQTVLFASKNNKAVDVVYERVNNLTSRPVMLRLGSDALQAQLAEYLSSLLQASISSADIALYSELESKHKELIKRGIDLANSQNELIQLRNQVDSIEQNIEAYRSMFGDSLFNSFRNFNSADYEKIKTLINRFDYDIDRYEKSKQNFFVSTLWFLFKEGRFEKAKLAYSNLDETLGKFCVNKLIEDMSEKAIPAFISNINELKENVKKAEDISQYYDALGKLKQHKSLFQLSLETIALEEMVGANSHELWETWLNLLPRKLGESDRRIIGDFVSLLNIIVKANAASSTIPKEIFAKYYKLLPKVTNIISCWSVTSLSVRSKVPFIQEFFDLVVIDEASQCDIASALPLLFRAKRAVIIGDNKQLTHITSINEKQDMQLLVKYKLHEDYLGWSYSGTSLFGLAQSVCSANDIISLKDHHRSHADIINFSNAEFYNNSLRVATKYEKLKTIKGEPSIRWVDVPGTVESPQSGSSLNKMEAIEVVKELNRLVQMKYHGTIGVVSPFRAQANYIRELIDKEPMLNEQLIQHDFLVDTVHKFQGDERDIMIFSPVIANNIGKGSLLFLSRTGNLFNVAITRARAVLVVIGDRTTCSSCGVKYMERFVDYINSTTLQKIEHDNSFTHLSEEYPSVSSSILVSDWEKILYKALYKNEIKTMPQYQVGQYSLDLALILNGKRLDIEVDGEKYHRNWDGELCKRDVMRNKRLIELGWDVLRFWVYEIRDDMDGCILRVQKWIDKNKAFN